MDTYSTITQQTIPLLQLQVSYCIFDFVHVSNHVMDLIELPQGKQNVTNINII